MIFGKIISKIYVIKANSAYYKGNVEEAVSCYEKAYKTGAAKADVGITYGYILLKYGELEKAMKVFGEQLSSPKLSNSDFYSLKINYALCLWKKGQLEAAVSELEKVIPSYKSTNIYGSLGYLYNLKGELDKALSFNLEAYDYNNSSPVILDNLGQTYYLSGDFKKAEEIFKKLIELKPKFPEAYYDYALVLEQIGNMEECIGQLKNALQYRTNFLSAITTEEITAKLEELEIK